jgi:hypothetical protein
MQQFCRLLCCSLSFIHESVYKHINIGHVGNTHFHGYTEGKFDHQ